MSGLEALIWVAVTTLLTPFLAYALAEYGIFFTRLETGDIKFVMRGLSLHHILYDVMGYELVDGKFVALVDPQERSKSFSFLSWFGLYWVGIPPFASVHSFTITKVKENAAGKGPTEWVKEERDVYVDSLRFFFPLPFVFRAVELGDGTTMDVLVVTRMRVTDPDKIVFELKGNIFENVSGLLEAAVGTKLKEYAIRANAAATLENFVRANRGEETGILSFLKSPGRGFNQELDKQVGLELVGVVISRYDAEKDEVAAAMEAEAIAQAQGAATIAKAEADALALERLARAYGERARQLVTALGGDTEAARKVLEAEALTGPNSKLTTLVTGGGAPPVLPIGGSQK